MEYLRVSEGSAHPLYILVECSSTLWFCSCHDSQRSKDQLSKPSIFNYQI